MEEVRWVVSNGVYPCRPSSVDPLSLKKCHPDLYSWNLFCADREQVFAQYDNISLFTHFDEFLASLDERTQNKIETYDEVVRSS